MPTFIKAGLWTKKKEGFKGELNLDQFVASKTSAASYKVYTALVTQSGGDDPISIDTGLLTIGVTYYINNNSPGMDFTNVGAPNNIAGESTYFVATGTTPASWGSDEDTGEGILVYNTGAPVVTVLENTIGNVWFTYETPGYYGVFTNGLLTDKISVITGARTSAWDGLTSIDTTNYTNSKFNLSTVDNTGSAVDNILLNTPIEIRVYN